MNNIESLQVIDYFQTLFPKEWFWSRYKDDPDKQAEFIRLMASAWADAFEKATFDEVMVAVKKYAKTGKCFPAIADIYELWKADKTWQLRQYDPDREDHPPVPDGMWHRNMWARNLRKYAETNPTGDNISRMLKSVERLEEQDREYMREHGISEEKADELDRAYLDECARLEKEWLERRKQKGYDK